MSKRRKKPAKKSGKWILPALAIGLVIVVLLAVVPLLGQNGQEDPGVTETSPTVLKQDPLINKIEFPLLLSDGMLEIESVFQYDGLNPDCGNKDGKNIAAITLKNLSGAYLTRADIRIKSSDGKTLHFVVTDLPAGGTVLAFSVDNVSIKAGTSYGDPVCEAVFDYNIPAQDDRVSASVDGTRIILQNNTDQQIGEIVVYCHATLGDQLFGGITYSYTVYNLIAGGTATLDAVDCILGLAEVARIVINEP